MYSIYKVKRPTEQDLDSALKAMQVLSDVSGDVLPGMDGSAPNAFDPDKFSHLLQFFNSVKATLVEAPGWHERVIAGMTAILSAPKIKFFDEKLDTFAPNQSYFQQQKTLEAQRVLLEQFMQNQGKLVKALEYIAQSATDHTIPSADIANTAKNALAKLQSNITHASLLHALDENEKKLVDRNFVQQNLVFTGKPNYTILFLGKPIGRMLLEFKSKDGVAHKKGRSVARVQNGDLVIETPSSGTPELALTKLAKLMVVAINMERWKLPENWEAFASVEKAQE